jgi:branched-chain amino acid transport system ATP-binding protein
MSEGLATAERRGAPLLEARGLGKSFGGVRAIDDLSLTIPHGQIRCIIGPNGAGKSTLFKLLMGIERPSEGTIKLNGQDITNLHPFQRARMGVGIKFQNMVVFKELTVLQNLFVPLRRHHKRRDIPEYAEKFLSQMHLGGTEDQRVLNLSHGQQQRLAIAMSLALEPKVLLLDEPAAGLSVEETREMADVIRRLNADGVTVVIIEHDMSFIRSLRSPTTVLHYGTVFMEGSFEEVELNEDVHRIYLGKM